MKIISKLKDYYDFIAGYDTDPRKVYTRHPDELKQADGPTDVSYAYHKEGGTPLFFLGEVWFCDVRYPYVCDIQRDRYYYLYEKIPEYIGGYIATTKAYAANDTYYYHIDLAYHFNIDQSQAKWHKNRFGRKGVYYSLNSFHQRERVQQKINTKYGSPVIYSWYKEEYGYGKGEVWKDKLLSEVGFGQVMGPKEAYTALYNWIPYHEPAMPSDPTDMGRFENKGFSKKTSFRGKQ